MKRNRKLALALLVASTAAACAAPGQHGGSSGGQCGSAGYETTTSGSIGAGYNTDKGQISTFGIGIHLRPRRGSADDCVVTSSSAPRIGVSITGSSENAINAASRTTPQIGVTLSGKTESTYDG